MSKVKVVLENADVDLKRVRNLRVEVGSKHIQTPNRALSLRDASSESRLIKYPKFRGINEIYRRLDRQKLDAIDNDKEKLLEFGKDLRRTFERPESQDDVNLLVISYEKNKDPSEGATAIPGEKEIQYLCNIVSHPIGDVTIPPRIPTLSGDAYFEFLKKFFVQLASYTMDSPMVGFVPFVARNDFDKIANLYIENGISSFVVDFENNNPIDAYLFAGQVHSLTDFILKEYKEDSYLHALNVPSTRTRQKVEVTPAKDIVTFAMGFDSYGTSHIPQPLPERVAKQRQEKLAQLRHSFAPRTGGSTIVRLDAEDAEVFRLFNRSDYGYYRSTSADLKNILLDEANASIKFDDLFNGKASKSRTMKLRKVFNVERQAIEAAELREKIGKESVLKHTESKKFARDSVRILRKISFQSPITGFM